MLATLGGLVMVLRWVQGRGAESWMGVVRREVHVVFSDCVASSGQVQGSRGRPIVFSTEIPTKFVDFKTDFVTTTT